MHPFSPQNCPVSCYRAISEEMWLTYRTFLYRAAFTSSFTLVSREPKELEVKYFKDKMHGKGEFFSPGKRNLAGVNTKQIMSCLLQVLPLPMPSVHLLVTILWSSTSPSPDTDVLYLLILDSLWPFTFYLKFSLPPLLFPLLFKLKDILTLTQSHRSILKGHKPDTLDWGQLLLEWEKCFGSSAQENRT